MKKIRKKYLLIMVVAVLSTTLFTVDGFAVVKNRARRINDRVSNRINDRMNLFSTQSSNTQADPIISEAYGPVFRFPLRLSKRIVKPNDRINAYSIGFRPGTDVIVTLPDGTSTTVKANERGAISFFYTIPETLKSGKYSLTAEGLLRGRLGGTLISTANIKVKNTERRRSIDRWSWFNTHRWYWFW